MKNLDFDFLDSIYFEHHGVKGQRWGVRRKNPSGAPEGLSDSELKAKVNRLRLEQEYRQLVSKANKANESILQKGLNLTAEILIGSGKKTAKEFVTKQMKKAIEKAGG